MDLGGFKMKQKVKSIVMGLIDAINAQIPRLLPDTPDKQSRFIGEILRIGEFPDNDSFRNSIVTQILHIPSDQGRASYAKFIQAIRRSIVNQLAFAKMNEYKEKAKNEQGA